MSYRPTIGGRLRRETSGVDRSQAGCCLWGFDPEKEIGQTCGLNVIVRRMATSDRSVVTAAKLVYSTWKITQPGERNGKAIYRNRSAPQPVYVLHTVGEREDVLDGVGAGMLPEVRMKDKQHGQLASLTQTRDTLVKLRTALKNKVNNILSARGLNLPKEALSSEKKLNEVLELPFDEIVRIELRVIVEQIRSLNKSIAELEKTIGEEGSKLEGHKGLLSIKGIGKITGAILLSVIGDVNNFPDEGRLASYFGIVPRVSNSNETERSGRIHKRGSKLGRTALVQSALIAANYSPYLKRFYERVKARRGAGKAIIALARKFLGIIYRTLKNKWVFEDFPNFVLAENA